MRQITPISLDYAGFAQLCGRSRIMREIMRVHNRIIPPIPTVDPRPSNHSMTLPAGLLMPAPAADIHQQSVCGASGYSSISVARA